MNKRCIVEGCSTAHYARGLCPGHYQRWKYNRQLNEPWQAKRGEIEKFIEEVLLSDTNECIIWPYGKSQGYAQVSKSNKFYDGSTRLHSIICRIKHGPPPSNKPQAAHSCANKLCINWKHLHWQSNKENSNNPITKARMSVSAKIRSVSAPRNSNGTFTKME